MFDRLKSNKNGFTLIELIISMTILITVIGLSYMTLNKTTEATGNQQSAFNIQQGINNLKRFANYDFSNGTYVSLKYSTESGDIIKDNIGYEEDILNIEDEIVGQIYANTEYNYEYIINTNGGPIRYTVNTNKKGSNYYYSITRIDDDAEMEIISNQKICSQDTEKYLPFELRHNTKTFYITINYLNRSTVNNYMFSIYSNVTRIIGVSPLPDPSPGPGEEPDPSPPPDPDEGFNPDYEVDGYLMNCLQIAKNGLDLALSKSDIFNHYKKLIDIRNEINQILVEKTITETQLSNIIVTLDNNKVKEHSKYHQSINGVNGVSVGDSISKSQSYLKVALSVLKHKGQNIENHISHNNMVLNQKLDQIKSENIDNYTDQFLRSELKNFDNSKIDSKKIEPIAVNLKNLIPLIGNIQNQAVANNNFNNINNYIEDIIKAQIDTINVYKKIDNIPSTHKDKIAKLDIAIERLLEIKCDLGDVDYYSK